MTNFVIGDRVRCRKAVPAENVLGILVGNIGVIENILPHDAYPYRVLWNASIFSKRPYFCGVTADEIELEY